MEKQAEAMWCVNRDAVWERKEKLHKRLSFKQRDRVQYQHLGYDATSINTVPALLVCEMNSLT